MDSEKEEEGGLEAEPDAKETADDPAFSKPLSVDVQCHVESAECMLIEGKTPGESDLGKEPHHLEHSERETAANEAAAHLQQDGPDGFMESNAAQTLPLGVSVQNDSQKYVETSGQTNFLLDTADVCLEGHGLTDYRETQQQHPHAMSGGEHTGQEEDKASESARFVAGVNSIVAMGFELGDAQAAMIQTENNVILAIDLLTVGHSPNEVPARTTGFGEEPSTQTLQSCQTEHFHSVFEEEAVLVEKDDTGLDEASHSSMPFSGKIDAQQLQGGVASLTESLRNNLGAFGKKIDRLVDDRLATAEKILDQKIKETSAVTTNRFSSFTSGAKTWGGLFSQKMSQAASKSTNFIKEVAKDLDLDHPVPDEPPLHNATCTLAIGQGLAPVALALHAER
jgi:hypothetical protein